MFLIILIYYGFHLNNRIEICNLYFVYIFLNVFAPGAKKNADSRSAKVHVGFSYFEYERNSQNGQ